MTQFAASTHPGLIRSHNEDCYAADPALGLWLVADGVGGHAHGEVAARIVRDTISTLCKQGCNLVEAIGRAHHAVLDEIRQQGNGGNMGSTIVALTLKDDAYEIVWVGDSRAYLYDGELKQLTRDHSPVTELLDSGVITPLEAEHHPGRHVLSQSLGVSEGSLVAAGHVQGRLQPGQQILLCSDGLSNELSDQAIVTRLATAIGPEAQVQALINGALEAGGHDNVTAVLVGTPVGELEPAAPSVQSFETTRDVSRFKFEDSGKLNSHDRVVLFILVIAMVLAAVWLVN